MVEAQGILISHFRCVLSQPVDRIGPLTDPATINIPYPVPVLELHHAEGQLKSSLASKQSGCVEGQSSGLAVSYW